MTTKVCNKCGVEHPLDYYYKNATKAFGVQGECKDCWRKYDSEQRMYINGKRINKDHPLWKPGRYNSLDDAWSHKEIDERSSEGEVYIIRNKAWADWYKVGKAVSSEDRLNGYQTSSPFRDYVLEYSEMFENRHQAESTIHRMLEKHEHCLERRGEWFKTYIPVIKEVMNDYRNQTIDSGHRDEQQAQFDLVSCNAGC
jgi:Fe-S cluster biosynthesis and repair protein YggX